MNWLELDKDTIFSGQDDKGNRYLSQFLADYKKTFNPDEINAGCKRCLDTYYTKMIKHLNMSKNTSKSKNSGYVLKKKYEGIPMAFGSRKLIYTHTLTDEIAESMLKNHPKGKELFQVIPETSKGKGSGQTGADNDPLKELLKSSRKELNTQASKLGVENPEEFQNKEEVAKAILGINSKGKGSEEE